MFCTYAHYKPQGGLFYIGKGKPRRAYAMDGRNPHWHNVVNKYGRPHVEILARWDTEEEALDHERLLISCFREMKVGIVNKSDGGQGSSGYRHTEESKRKNSLAKMGSIPWNKGLKGVMPEPWNKGTKTPEEVRAKQSIARQGKPSPRKGAKHSADSIAKMKATKAFNPKPMLSDTGRNKIILAVRGYKHIQATCIHCRTTGGVTGMARWHFDNCRLKGITQ